VRSPLIRHFPLVNSRSIIYPAVLIDISGERLLRMSAAVQRW